MDELPEYIKEVLDKVSEPIPVICLMNWIEDHFSYKIAINYQEAIYVYLSERGKISKRMPDRQN